jgi:long-chain acyl-CoA synthetase
VISFRKQKVEEGNSEGMVQAAATLPAAFRRAVEQRSNSVFMNTKRLGIWEHMSWQEAGRAVDEVAAGLLTLGIKPGQVVCTVANTTANCFLADAAILAIGAVSAALSPQGSSDLVDLCQRSGAVLILVEDEDQLDAIQGDERMRCDSITFVLFSHEASQTSERLTWQKLRKLGSDASAQMQSLLIDRAAGITPTDTAILSCSAGATAPPRWVGHSHAAVLATCRAFHEQVSHTQADRRLSFLSWSRANERLLGMYLPVLYGAQINFSEGVDTVPENLREVQPTIVSATPRHLRKLHAEIVAALDDAGAIPRAMYRWALAQGSAVVERTERGSPMSFSLRLRATFGRKLVLNNLRRFLGLSQCKHLVVLDAALSPSLAHWYCALGVPVVQTWGTTQTLGLATINVLPNSRSGSVGRPLSIHRVEVDTVTNELLISGPSIPESRCETQSETHFKDVCRTGDLGRIDAAGFVHLNGRVTEHLRNLEGEAISAGKIQQALRESRYVRDALVLAEGRPFVSAFLLLARSEIEHHAQRIGLAFSDFAELTRTDEIRRLMQAEIDLINERLDGAHRIKGFYLFEIDLDTGEEELTSTSQLRRWIVEPRWHQQIESIYLAR